MSEQQKWRCRNCRAVLTREQCTTRNGVLECGACLHRHQAVGLLEPVTDEYDEGFDGGFDDDEFDDEDDDW